MINRTLLLAGVAGLFASLAACGPDATEAGLAPPADGIRQNGPTATTSPTMVDLRSISNPEALQTADVTDRAGAPVGSVERVEVAADGKLSGLVIELDDGGDLVMATPTQARYDERASRVALMVTVDELAQAS